jgi:hypothetical protein
MEREIRENGRAQAFVCCSSTKALEHMIGHAEIKSTRIT